MMYIPNHLQSSNGEVDEKEYITLNDLVRVHYATFHTFDDFDGGLSIFDRLLIKLSRYFTTVRYWNIEKMKNQIRNSVHPQDEFMLILDEILTQEMIDCYGY